MQRMDDKVVRVDTGETSSSNFKAKISQLGIPLKCRFRIIRCEEGPESLHLNKLLGNVDTARQCDTP